GLLLGRYHRAGVGFHARRRSRSPSHRRAIQARYRQHTAGEEAGCRIPGALRSDIGGAAELRAGDGPEARHGGLRRRDRVVCRVALSQPGSPNRDFSTIVGDYRRLAWWSVFIVSARDGPWISRNMSRAIRPRMVA